MCDAITLSLSLYSSLLLHEYSGSVLLCVPSSFFFSHFHSMLCLQLAWLLASLTCVNVIYGCHQIYHLFDYLWSEASVVQSILYNLFERERERGKIMELLLHIYEFVYCFASLTVFHSCDFHFVLFLCVSLSFSLLFCINFIVLYLRDNVIL